MLLFITYSSEHPDKFGPFNIKNDIAILFNSIDVSKTLAQCCHLGDANEVFLGVNVSVEFFWKSRGVNAERCQGYLREFPGHLEGADCVHVAGHDRDAAVRLPRVPENDLAMQVHLEVMDI